MYLMMNQEKLTKNNFLLYAMKHYSNPGCTGIDEFHEDLNRIKYIKRLLGRYHTKGILKYRLILNHIIILQNTLGAEPACRILFFKLESKYHSYLKTFLEYLQYLPHTIPETDLEEIPIDHKVLKILGDLE
tara:strand:- start:7767 stop:8159 length:393 start_codon:yes stop_codon:yes gene_type:complete